MRVPGDRARAGRILEGRCDRNELNCAFLGTRLLEGVAEEDGQQRGGARGPDGRRPADVYLPCWRVGRPAALDFAVTSGLRIGAVGESAADGSAATTLYAARKRAFLDTDAHCAEQGLEFIPMVVEASGGGWGSD
eukprot:gene57198-biopygen1283